MKQTINDMNIFGDTYTYKVVFNSKMNRYEVEEYKNGEFWGHVIETPSKAKAQERLRSLVA